MLPTNCWAAPRRPTRLGAEFNAELERARVIEAGHAAEEEPFVQPRRAPKTATG